MQSDMCKWLRDILFPTNILGKKKQCVAVSWADTPEVDGYKVFNVFFIGERLEMSYTREVRKLFYHHGEKYIWYYPEKVLFDLSDPDHYDMLEIKSGHEGGFYHRCSDIFFNCTNCESLEVNGVKLI